MMEPHDHFWSCKIAAKRREGCRGSCSKVFAYHSQEKVARVVDSAPNIAPVVQLLIRHHLNLTVVNISLDLEIQEHWIDVEVTQMRGIRDHQPLCGLQVDETSLATFAKLCGDKFGCTRSAAKIRRSTSMPSFSPFLYSHIYAYEYNVNVRDRGDKSPDSPISLKQFQSMIA